ncbi:MAG: hypothetical protein AB1861_15335 [Cyanobacteriota bacterium]
MCFTTPVNKQLLAIAPTASPYFPEVSTSTNMASAKPLAVL